MNVKRAWLEPSQRRYRDLVEGKVNGVPGSIVLTRLRGRLRGQRLVATRRDKNL
jgi:hypothetical protein